MVYLNTVPFFSLRGQFRPGTKLHKATLQVPNDKEKGIFEYIELQHSEILSVNGTQHGHVYQPDRSVITSYKKDTRWRTTEADELTSESPVK